MTCALSRVNKKERVRHQQHKESLLLFLQLLLLLGSSTSRCPTLIPTLIRNLQTTIFAEGLPSNIGLWPLVLALSIEPQAACTLKNNG